MEDMADKNYKGNYQTDFDPDLFMNTYHGPVGGSVSLYDEMVLNWLHDIFSPGKIVGQKLLDIGTGPSIHTVISASLHVKEIYLSDYLERNRQVIESWVNGDKRYTHMIDYVLKKEGNSTSIENRTEELKQKIKAIYPIDLTSLQNFPGAQNLYDVIISSFCIQVVAKSSEEYSVMFEKISNMLKKGGHMVMIGPTNGTIYYVGNYEYPVTAPDRLELEDMYKKAGLQVLYGQEEPVPENISQMKIANTEKIYIVVLRKM